MYITSVLKRFKKKKNILKLNLSFQRFTARNGACNDVFYYVK